MKPRRKEDTKCLNWTTVRGLERNSVDKRDLEVAAVKLSDRLDEEV